MRWKGPKKPSKPKDGRCIQCGRQDVLRSGEQLAFHYSPAPCETPCAGGRLSYAQEDLDMGTHPTRCVCTKRATG